MDAAVEIRGLGKRFGEVVALDGIDATIARGRLTGLVGPDGAGKTTLLRLVAGLLQPGAGGLRVAGHDVVADAAEVHRITGYMPQRFGLHEDLSVLQNLGFHAELRGLHGADRADTFERLLAFTGLAPFRERLAGRLSGGMKQKLGLACALMGDPQVLLLDEPSVGVDPLSRRELWRLVGELADQGMAVVWSTAYLDEAERCASVLLLNEGRLAFDGPPRELAARVAGRSFRLAWPHGGAGGDRRDVLAEVLDLPAVRDGVIQGDALRVVLAAQAGDAALADFARRHAATLEPVAARFEDAFIDLLGGGPGGRSALAGRMDPVRLDTDVAVACTHLTRRFGDFVAADDVSFEVRKGEIFGLLGPNGAGKSTTFRMLCGLLRPSAGEARVAGFDLGRAPGAAKRRIGYMAQKFSLYGLLSVRQNLAFFSGVYGLHGARRTRRVDEMIATFGLDPWLDAAPTDLPPGFRQRLALACALLHQPPVLFLDEPTSGVDPVTRREFWTHINGLVRKGVTVVVTTHFMDEAEYCDRVGLMYRARVIALDTPDALKAAVSGDAASGVDMEEAFVRLVERAGIAQSERAAA